MGVLDDLGNSKMMGGGSKKTSPQDVMAVVEILSTNVETINQQLANSGMNASFYANLKEFLPYITNILQYLSQEMVKVQKSNAELNSAMQNMQKKNNQILEGINQVVQKQNEKLDNYLKNLAPTQELISKTVVGSNEAFSGKINEMIDIHLSEIALLRKQNATFIEKMEDLENAIKKFLNKG